MSKIKIDPILLEDHHAYESNRKQHAQLTRDEDDLEQPLLTDIPLESPAACQHQSGGGAAVVTEIPKFLYGKFLILGIILGFSTQALSLGATALMISRWGRTDIVLKDATDRLYYYFLWFAKQTGFCLYPIEVFFPVSFALTEPGIELFKSYVLRQPGTTKVSSTARRSAFLAGVSTFTGVVIGSFLTWVSIDLYLSISYLLLPTCSSLFVCIALCYTMVLLFDRGFKN